MTPEEIYSDFRALVGMNAPLKTKRDMLGWLLKNGPNWVVVGVTRAAVETMAANGFRKVSRDGIERAHLTSRAEIYNRLLTEEPSLNEFWEVLHRFDRTVICANAAPHRENKRIAEVAFYPVPSGLFLDNHIGWKHGQTERDFLASVYDQRDRLPMAKSEA